MAGFDDFFNAIAGQESGGNYNAVNGSTGALGKYQILPSNVPGWSQQYLGVTWSPQQFLNDPAKQDALAKAVLSHYYDQWGPRGAASAWYSGNPALANDYGGQPGGPSIGAYVDDVIARMTGGAASTAVGNIMNSAVVQDSTVAQQQQEQAITHQPRSDAGMGAVTAAGIDTALNHGVDAVTGPGAQAVGMVNPSDLLKSTDSNQPGSSTPSNAYTVARSMRYYATQQAQHYLGIPYVYGGGGSEGPSSSPLAHGNFGQVGFDCSGLVQYALAQAGINAPRLSYDQLAMGQRTAINSLEPGDLIGFGNGEHVAIWLGNGQILEAPHTGASVRVRNLDPSEDAWGVSLAGLYK